MRMHAHKQRVCLTETVRVPLHGMQAQPKEDCAIFPDFVWH